NSQKKNQRRRVVWFDVWFGCRWQGGGIHCFGRGWEGRAKTWCRVFGVKQSRAFIVLRKTVESNFGTSSPTNFIFIILPNQNPPSSCLNFFVRTSDMTVSSGRSHSSSAYLYKSKYTP